MGQTFNAGLTYYTQTARNNCGVPWPSDNMYAALSTNLYDNPSGSSACGKCVQVTGRSGTPRTLVIVDQCPASSNPPCTSSHLDLSPQAFNAVQGNMSPGNLPNSPGLTVKFVPCTVTGNLQYSFDPSSMKYYLAMVIQNSRYGIQSVKYRSCGTTGWTAMGARSDANAHWTIATNPPNPIDLQVTDEWGRVIEDDNITWGAGKTVTSGAQFAACP